MKRMVLGFVVALLAVYGLAGQAQSTSDFAAAVDKIARDALAATGVPSASIAIVRDGAVVYTHAYGNATLPATAATTTMRYSIGSISKQFTSAAILLLQEQKKLSLDDPVSKYVTGLTRGGEVTIRQVLSHTSGYQDYWPQDYVPPFMLTPINAQGILDRWARRPLDFDPGTQWQYSNTNYVIAGLIVEKAAGMPLWQFLNQRIFAPLGITTATNIDERGLPAGDPTGYFRYALGPPRPAPKEGPGWLFAAGEIAMTPADLAKWDISMLKRSVLSAASYDALASEVRLKNGAGTGYGLGVSVNVVAGHRQIEHNGEVSGFTAENIVLPDDHAAIVVLTNQDAASAAGAIGSSIRTLLLPAQAPAAADNSRNALVKRVFDDLRQGKIDRSLFTDNCNAYFTDQALKDYAASLQPLGEYTSLTATGVRSRGGMIYRGFQVRFASRTVALSIFEMPDGKFEQFLVVAR
ncbi:MAG TPA: serine hydrolase domain-containing protein [Vicinamibacterales bacterium]|nr:serine hydrolase domain-containing protein [Vicinamibacterales bacterium]